MWIVATVLVFSLCVVALLSFYAYLHFLRLVHGRVSRMNGKTVIVTGANRGIGKETAKELAKRGARVIMACRNLETGKQVRDDIMESTKNETVILKKLDLASQHSIREFAKDILRTEGRLDVLIHNAGIAESKFKKTEDGLEINMATNHFGPFLLTHLLIDLLKKSAPSRIIAVSSVVHRFAFFNTNKINPPSSWCPAYMYFISKYANISFTLELARRLEGTNVTANCLHPGLIKTEIWDVASFPLNLITKLIIKRFLKTPAQGCQTTVFLACSEEVQGVTGKYFTDRAETEPSKSVRDKSKMKKLWELSKKFSNLKPTDPDI